MAFCPLEDTSGFVQWSDRISNSIFNSLSVDDSPPIHFAFSPATIISPVTDQNHLLDVTGHTCVYQGKTYECTDIQICKPIHFVNNGYHLPTQASTQATAELVISFVARTGDKGRPGVIDGILLCLPIFVDTASSENAAYLEQMNSSHTDVSKIVSMESLFSDARFGSFHYTTCFEVRMDKRKSLALFVFPYGIRVTDTSFPLNAYRTIPYKIPASIRDQQDTMSAYTLTQEGVKNNPTWSSGELYTTAISVTSANFKQRFPYYLLKPKKVGETRKVDTFLQRCVPFTDSPNTGDFKNSHVMPGTTTMQRVLEERYTLEEEQKKVVTVKEGLSTGTIEGIIAGFIILFIFVAIFIAAPYSDDGNAFRAFSMALLVFGPIIALFYFYA